MCTRWSTPKVERRGSTATPRRGRRRNRASQTASPRASRARCASSTTASSGRAPASGSTMSGSGSAGSPSRRHRSMKCSCDAELSFNSDARHLAMNAPGVIVSDGSARRVRDAARVVRSNGARRLAPIPCRSSLLCKMQSRCAGCKTRGFAVDHRRCCSLAAAVSCQEAPRAPRCSTNTPPRSPPVGHPVQAAARPTVGSH